jgi:hypothetical protein
MDIRSNFEVAKILCVELYEDLLKSRCDVLKYSGYDAASASPKIAEILLRSQKFELIVLSRLSDFDLHRINNVADGTNTGPRWVHLAVGVALFGVSTTEPRSAASLTRGTVSFKIRSMGPGTVAS